MRSNKDYFASRHTVIQDIDMSDDESLDEYFDNYVPLSSLPTPPLSSTAPTPTEETFGEADPLVLGQAKHLANLVPQQGIRLPPQISTIASMVTRAQLPLETLALAACVLDALSSQFGRTWRNVVCKLPSSSPPVGGFPLPPSETIVLAALKVSASFLDDSRTADPNVWASHVGGSAGITASALEATVRVVLADIGYEMCSFSPEDVERRMKGMMKGAEAAAKEMANSDFQVRGEEMEICEDESVWVQGIAT